MQNTHWTAMPRNPYQIDEEPSDIEFDAYEAHEGDRLFASTLARGMQILRCFTPLEPALGNKELARRTGLSPPTISRFTYTLVKLGYLRPDTLSGKYRLAPGVVSLGYPLLASLTLRQLARPLMNVLAESMNCSVSMGIRDRLSIVYVETSRITSAFAPQLSDIGLRFPIVSTAIGHAFISGCEPTERQKLLNEIRVKTPRMWTEHQDHAARSVEAFAKKGFCSVYGEQHPDHYAVGVPMGRLRDGELIVFNAVIPRFRASRQSVEEGLAPRLVEMVAQVRRSSYAV
ncbi:IclR family transcriptional regulator [Pigmentiphaga kullae]|nr:IclR family transcriptional regulator [Pigmentiphaga kullae]